MPAGAPDSVFRYCLPPTIEVRFPKVLDKSWMEIQIKHTFIGTNTRTASCSASPSFLKDMSGVRTAPAAIKIVNSSGLLLVVGKNVGMCSQVLTLE
jgi:hypothetical protein